MRAVAKGRIVGGKYRLDERLAGGGMGSVWRGYDLRLDIPVAVKFMHEKLAADEKLRARFEREAKAAAKIRSPHVVHMYDHGIEDGTPYLVMEFLAGEDLDTRLKRTGPMPLGEVDRICSEICKGLHRAHRQGIIHRDLKPANVFLSAPDDDLVKLLDFGIAKASGIKPVGGETTDTDQLLGSPHYMSPEQVRGGNLDARSDLWAVAVILYRLIAGARPIEGTDLGDLCVRICTDRIEPPSLHRANLDRRVDRFFERAFCRDREGRFQSAKELAAAFSAVVRSVPTALADDKTLASADPSSSWDRSDTARSVDRPPRSLPTRKVGRGAVDPQLTPIASSRTHAGLRRPGARWSYGLGGLLLVGVGAALAVATLAPEDDSPDAAGAPASAASGIAAPSDDPAVATATPAEIAPSTPASAAPDSTALDAGSVAAASGRAEVPAPPPRVSGRATAATRPTGTRPAAPPVPATTTAPPSVSATKPGDIGLGY